MGREAAWSSVGLQRGSASSCMILDRPMDALDRLEGPTRLTLLAFVRRRTKVSRSVSQFSALSFH